MIDFGEGSLEKWNIDNKCGSDLLLRPPVCPLTHQRDCNDKSSREPSKKRWRPWKGPSQTVQLILGLKLKPNDTEASHIFFFKDTRAGKFHQREQLGRIRRMLSAAQGHNFRGAWWGWICSSGAEQLAIVGSFLSCVPKRVTCQTTNKSPQCGSWQLWLIGGARASNRVGGGLLCATKLLNIWITAFVLKYPDLITWNGLFRSDPFSDHSTDRANMAECAATLHQLFGCLDDQKMMSSSPSRQPRRSCCLTGRLTSSYCMYYSSSANQLHNNCWCAVRIRPARSQTNADTRADTATQRGGPLVLMCR